MKRNNGKAGKAGKAGKVDAAQAKVTKAKANAAKVTSKAKAKVAAKPESAPRIDTFGTELTGGMKWGTGMTIDDSMVITHVADNNKRGASRERFAKYKVGRTVAQTLAIDGGPHRGDIRWDAGKGLIELRAASKASKAKAGNGKAKRA